MNKYEDTRHPLTGDLMRKLSYSSADFQAVKDFINEHYKEDYTLSFFDTLSNSNIEFDNDISEILDDVPYIVATISSIEHTFVNWVGINCLSDSYVVSIDITRGNFEVGCIYHYDKCTKKITKRM